MTHVWPAPAAAQPIRATVAVPGSKSQTARELVLSALADGPSTLRAPLRSRDSLLMVDGLAALGVTTRDAHGALVSGTARDADGALVSGTASLPDAATPTATPGGVETWVVRPGRLVAPATVECGLAGTVMRFLAPVAALAHGDVRFQGDAEAASRPIGGLLDALTDLGVGVVRPEQGSLPFTIRGEGSVPGGSVTMRAAESSQFVSALLLSGGRFDRGLDLTVAGDMPSLPHVEMTVAALHGRGIEVSSGGPGSWRVPPGSPEAASVSIEPDLSNAAPFLAAAAVTAGEVTIAGWPPTSLQPGHDIVRLLETMGASSSFGPEGLTLTGPRRLRGLGEVDLSHAGELVPTVAALCALAEGTTVIRGISHLRGHETDRLAALRTELTRVGAHVQESEDGLRIAPGPLRSATMQTYHDHRMATAAAIIGLRVPGIQVIDVETTAKTLPGFTRMWQAMLS